MDARWWLLPLQATFTASVALLVLALSIAQLQGGGVPGIFLALLGILGGAMLLCLAAGALDVHGRGPNRDPSTTILTRANR